MYDYLECESRRLPDNWLSSQLVIFARARQRGVVADGWRKLHCSECKYSAKKQRKLRGGCCIFNSEWAKTFPGIRGSNQSAAKAYCVAGNTHFGIGGRHDVKRHIERAAHIAKAQSSLGSINRFVGLSLLAAKSTR